MALSFSALIDQMTQTRVLVIGDAMLDLYSEGTSTRQSPEAPVPVIVKNDTQAILGGAANVAANLAALGVEVQFICLTGQDANRATLISLLKEKGIGVEGCIIDATRPTISKERVTMNNAAFARIDQEKTHDVDGVARAVLLEVYETSLADADVVILSDYCKGTLPDSMISVLLAKAAANNIPVMVDSKKKDFSVFAGALLAKPNKKELAERSGQADVSHDAAIEKAARLLMQESGLHAILASRSEQGAMLVTPEAAHGYPATARHVSEVSGAGDTLLAVCAAALAAGANLRDAAYIGSLAAGVAVEKSGTACVTREELTDAVLRYEQERKTA